MSNSSAAARVISLYRQILRAAIHWADAEEKRYIRSEAAKQFRANRSTTGAEQEAALKEGETRLHYAQHYGIPYPRLHHTKVRKRFAPQMDFGHSVPHSRDAKADSKLARAAERLEQQRQQKAKSMPRGSGTS
jgi:hypothetical protein